MFKMAMESNSKATMLPTFDVNPLTCLWKAMNASYLLTHSIAPNVKLTEIMVVHVPGSVENERCCSSLSFLKNKLHDSPNKC